ncbi:ABC transporter family substrate-binding protein [Arthrobacter castelli]|uniref:ABC transporter family substrate-binding protein n=1 Tax=Arthrobacter castelli TaxID=271431 RepID=UPI00047941BE|nr:ABC transporter family substrate-binding protein [Arthrobacter castelli]
MRSTRKTLGIALASMLALAGCSGGDATSNTAGGGSTMETQPAEGVPASYQGELPLPEADQAYNNPTDRESIQDGGKLQLPIGSLGPQFNNAHVNGNTISNGELMHKIGPQIWDVTVGGKITPNEEYLLSAEVTSKDPMVVEYEINPDAVWNDGTPIDWTAFEATWTAMNGENEKFQPYSTDGYSNIESVEQGDNPKHVVVTFDKPFYPYTSLFGRLLHPDNADPQVFNKGWVDQIPTEMLAGPYTVKKYDKTAGRIVMVPNPNWWGAEPKLDRISYTVMEPSASINAFVNGEVDATEVGSADRLEQVRGMGDEAMIRRGIGTGTRTFMMQEQEEGFFSDPMARKAVMLGTDRRQLAQIMSRGLDWEEEPPGSLLWRPFQDGYEDLIADLHYDAEAARQTLEEAGWVKGEDGIRTKNGERATFQYVDFTDSQLNAAVARAYQQMMKAIGVKLVIDNRPGSEFATTASEGTYDMLSMVWGFGGAPNAYSDSACQIYCGGDEGTYYTNMVHKELDQQLKKISTISDVQKAKATSKEAESAALHNYGVFPWYTGPDMVAVKTGLANYGPAGFKTVPAENIGWEKES